MTENKIRFLRKKSGLTQPDMAKKIGISQSLLSLIENGSREITPKMQNEIAAVLNVKIEDLFRLNENNSPQAADVAKIEMLDVTACCGNGVDNLSENSIGEWIMPLQEFRQITFADPQNIKMLKVVGDSMSPTLKAGDWVLVDISQQTPDVDGMYLLRMATGLAVKRLQIGLNDIQVVSDNKDKYKPIAASVGEIKVVGRVIYTLNAERVG